MMGVHVRLIMIWPQRPESSIYISSAALSLGSRIKRSQAIVQETSASTRGPRVRYMNKTGDLPGPPLWLDITARNVHQQISFSMEVPF
jgi:hypothetical protein